MLQPFFCVVAVVIIMHITTTAPPTGPHRADCKRLVLDSKYKFKYNGSMIENVIHIFGFLLHFRFPICFLITQNVIISVRPFRENEAWRGHVGPGGSKVLESKETR